jgi:hypothetical protein
MIPHSVPVTGIAALRLFYGPPVLLQLLDTPMATCVTARFSASGAGYTQPVEHPMHPKPACVRR